PPGRGAVATVRITGSGAAEIVAQCFYCRGQNTRGDFPLDQIRYGRWGNVSGEEVVLCRRPADNDAIDIHCHGGAAAVRAIVQSLVARGAREVAPGGGESIWWPLTSYNAQDAIRHEIDSRPLYLAVEAQQALAEARTLRTA